MYFILSGIDQFGHENRMRLVFINHFPVVPFSGDIHNTRSSLRGSPIYNWEPPGHMTSTDDHFSFQHLSGSLTESSLFAGVASPLSQKRIHCEDSGFIASSFLPTWIQFQAIVNSNSASILQRKVEIQGT